MIDVYYWPTPNGWKISIMLEECALPYRVHKVDIGKGDQFGSGFVEVNPNSKIRLPMAQSASALAINTTCEHRSTVRRE